MVDAWMPYYGNDVERAVKPYPRAIKWSYQAALWHYWNHTHCEGLPNDDAYLMSVCDCPQHEWQATKGAIFGPLFRLVGNLWQQKRAQEEWAKAQDLKAKRSQAGSAGAASRWQTDGKTDGNAMASEVAKSCPSPSPSPDNTHTAEIPTKDEVFAYGTMHGVSEESCKSFFDHHEGNSVWVNQHGRLINWKHKLVAWGTKDRKTKPHETDQRIGQRVNRNVGTLNEGREAEYAKRKRVA